MNSYKIKPFEIFIIIFSFIVLAFSDRDSERLLEDLLSKYDNIVRPVVNPNDTIKLFLGIKLSQIADIDEKNQIMTTNVWLRHQWYDRKLVWDPANYGNTSKINIPSTSIWLPDVVLYNNADGDYQITTKTKATIHFDGRIIWEPPMIYKSYCAINIEYYPFDIQDCYMKFGTWTFDGDLIDLEHVNLNQSIKEKNVVVIKKGGISTKLYTVNWGIDMSDYYQSVEWDVLSIPAQKNIKYYDCCVEPYYDIYFNITLRRKTLFYTVNLIIPCVNISFLAVLVFYLPSDSGEKITLGISILVALLVFYLLLIELIPPTSLVIPLLGKYLLFTLVLVNLSILLTIFILNLHHRHPNTHRMPKWVRLILIDKLPKYLMISRPIINDSSNHNLLFQEPKAWIQKANSYLVNGSISKNDPILSFGESRLSSSYSLPKNEYLMRSSIYHNYPLSIQNAFKGVKYVNNFIKESNQERKEMDDWKFVAMVIDRLLLWLFSLAFFTGTLGILLKAPSIYDERKALLRNSF